jgi:hypothetical protein
MNDDYSSEYNRAMEVAKRDGVDISNTYKIKSFSNNFYNDKDYRELFNSRVKIQNELGANEFFSGNGLTAYTGEECNNEYGVVETFNFDKNPKTIGNMLSGGRIKLIDTSPIK